MLTYQDGREQKEGVSPGAARGYIEDHRRDRGAHPQGDRVSDQGRHRSRLGHGRGALPVLRHGDHRHVVQKSQQNHEDGIQLAVKKENDRTEEEEDVDRRGQPIAHVGEETGKDLPGFHHGAIHGAQAFRCEDHGRGILRRIGRVADRDAALRRGQGRRIVHPVARHPHHQVVSVLQHQDALSLVPRQHLSESASIPNKLVPAEASHGSQKKNKKNKKKNKKNMHE
eukprot:scaffold266_cov248-Pinguiococcus_pyrenoidosus.AAC.3